MSTTNIRSALVTRLEALSLSQSISYENIQFSPPSDDIWLRFNFIPTNTLPVTLGQGGDDEAVGMAQIDVFAPTNTGTSEPYALAEIVKNTFVVGNIFEYNTTKVRITSTRIDIIGTIENQYHIAVTVNWSAYLQRPPLT
jgi:hypothetical protein